MEIRHTAMRMVWAGAVALVAASGCGSEDGRELETLEAAVVYGYDGRVQVFEETDQLWLDRAMQSTVALVRKGSLSFDAAGNVSYDTSALQQARNLCSDQSFLYEPTAAFCSGTLVDDDLVLTAGHCVTNRKGCKDTRFVFRYAMASASSMYGVTEADVFACADIVTRVETSTLDYAIIRLDRPATPRFSPAPVRKGADAVALDSPLLVIGCPSGIPFKLEGSGWVRDNRASALDYFVANTDTFGGNSGSGVYLQDTGELAGILVRGEVDYLYYGYPEYCYRVNVCPDTGCDGEDITYAFRATDAFCASEWSTRLCASGPYCGDGTCDPGEGTADCPADCGSACGDGACNGGEGTATCPFDCGSECGDGACNGSEGTADCPADCGSACGDGACNGSEDYVGCPADCPAPVCGDGVCEGDETEASCPDDCAVTSACGDGVCAGWAEGEDCGSCPADCECSGPGCKKACCGDGVCTKFESAAACPVDCL